MMLHYIINYSMLNCFLLLCCFLLHQTAIFILKGVELRVQEIRFFFFLNGSLPVRTYDNTYFSMLE